MCDTLVAVGDDAVAFAKNSDREPSEAQVVEHIEQTKETHEIVISRPVWMWGAEMGANEHGLAIGNEAVFTRVPIEDDAPLGMDLLRDALERCKDADEALDRITWRIAREGQTGTGFRNRKLRYHNAFLIADVRHAWLLETAGRFWAACWIRNGIRTASNVLSIGVEYTKVGPGTIEGARSLGFTRRGETFDFRRAFAAPVMGWLSGGDVRRACTTDALASGNAGVVDLARALRDHRGKRPSAGARIVAPCAHASWMPTRGSGQTTGSMISILRDGATKHFFTGTSSPCLSVFKPVPLGRGRVDTGPLPRKGGYDDKSLFWRHERLHRAVLESYDRRRASFEGDRVAYETKILSEPSPTAASASAIFADHRERVGGWYHTAIASGRRRPSISAAWWRRQSKRDGVPTSCRPIARARSPRRPAARVGCSICCSSRAASRHSSSRSSSAFFCSSSWRALRAERTRHSVSPS
jgi:secernin